MARQRTEMTPSRRAAVDEVRTAYAAYEARRDQERADAWRIAMEEIDRRAAHEKSQLIAALERALEQGVTRGMLQTPEVLGSTDQAKVNRILGTAPRRKRRDGSVPMFTWLDEDTARVVIPEFATTSVADDYPEVLAGVVKRDHTMPGGWAALTDESDEGEMPGHLKWELNQEPSPRHIGTLLDGLAAQAKR